MVRDYSRKVNSQIQHRTESFIEILLIVYLLEMQANAMVHNKLLKKASIAMPFLIPIRLADFNKALTAISLCLYLHCERPSYCLATELFF